MEKRLSITASIGIIYLAMLVAGILSFTLAGGISRLASDVGLSGAWIVLTLSQLLYGTLSVLAFVAFTYMVKKYKKIIPTTIPTILCVVIVSVSINLFGIYQTGLGVDFLLFCLLVIAFTFVLLVTITQIYNGLTRRSKIDAP